MADTKGEEATSDMDSLDMDNFTNDSALMIAYERGLESERPDALIKDPFAKFLQGTKGEALSQQFGTGCGNFGFEGWLEFHQMWTAVRTKFIDDALAKSSKDVNQFVNLGAGLDTRSFRLDCFKDLKAAFEVDMEVINTFKVSKISQLKMTPLCERFEVISHNFLDENTTLKTELVAKGFDTQKPAIFIAEGLIQYLGAGKEKFLDDVADAAACVGSVFVLQYMDVTGTAFPEVYGVSESVLRSKFGATWDLEVFKFGEEALNFGRYDLEKFQPNAMFSFMVAKKKAAL